MSNLNRLYLLKPAFYLLCPCFILFACTFSSCDNNRNKTLPYLGERNVVNGDTIFHTIPPFSLMNQDNLIINNDSLSDAIYVADFFYTYCPTICPIVISQMQRIHNKFENRERVKMVSFALDPKRDDVTRLKQYSEQLLINSNQWYFLTGDKESIWDLADDYFISVAEDREEPGGIAHSGKIILVDQYGHVRGFAEGTDGEDVSELMKEIEWLLRE